jgi:hypothetical protein
VRLSKNASRPDGCRRGNEERVNTVQKKKSGYWGWTWAIFFVVLAAEIAGAYILLYRKGYILSDAMSRTANAYYVLYIDPPKLASIGFVWNPLPSFLQIPILLFKDVWPLLATHGVAGGIVTAFFAACNAALLFRTFKHYSVSTALSVILVLLFAFNPFMFYYGCNGMSEMPFFTTIIACVVGLCRWLDERDNHKLLVMMAFSLALGFLCRYEAFAITLGLGISLLIVVFGMKDPFSPFAPKPLRMKAEYAMATGLVLFLPVVYSVVVWIILNWSIMGDPFYFLTSSYSNTAQSEFILSAEIINAMSSPMEALLFSLGRMLPFLPLFIVITISRMFSKRLFKPDYCVLVTIIGCISAFHFLMLLSGGSFGWPRFFSFSLPICAAWLPYELSRLKGAVRHISVAAVVVAFLVSASIVVSYFGSPVHAPEEYEAFVQTDVSGVVVQRAAAERINEAYSDDVMMMDSFTMSTLIVNLDHPERLIISTSDQFNDALEAPWRYGVRYIVVADPSGVGSLDAFNMTYPSLYEEGADWCMEREEVGGFKIFEVLY